MSFGETDQQQGKPTLHIKASSLADAAAAAQALCMLLGYQTCIAAFLA
jgi:hypothetical protein